MKITTDAVTSSHGMPVFVDDDGHPLDYWQGFAMLRNEKGWTYQDLADKCGVSKRTAEGWGQGRIPSKSAMLLLSHHI